MARPSLRPGSPHDGRGGEVSDGIHALADARRRWRTDRVSHERYEAPNVAFVAGVDGALGAVLTRRARAEHTAPVALGEKPHDSFPAAPRGAHRARTAVRGGLVGIAPLYYRNPAQFFSRTCFTRAAQHHAGMVLRRLAGGNRRFDAIPPSLGSHGEKGCRRSTRKGLEGVGRRAAGTRGSRLIRISIELRETRV